MLFIVYPMLREMRNDNGRYKTGCRPNEVDDAVKWTGKVGRQVLRILQIGQRRCSVEAQRHRDDGHMHVWIFTDEAEWDQ